MLLEAAAAAGLAASMQDHLVQGLNAATACQLVAVSFPDRIPFAPEYCRWVVWALAIALGLAAVGNADLGAGPITFLAAGQRQ